MRYNHTACMHVRRKQACSSCASPKTCDSRAHLLVWSTKGRARHRRAHAQSLAPTKWLAHGLNCARIGRGAPYGSAQRADWRARTAQMGAPDPDPPGRCSACVEAVWLVCRGPVGGSIAALQSPFDHQWEMQDICRGPAENITLNSSRVSSRGVLRVYLLTSMFTAGPRPA